MEKLQNVPDGEELQKALLRKSGEQMGEVIGQNLSTKAIETEIELNFAVVKIRHKIIRGGKEELYGKERVLCAAKNRRKNR